MRSICTSIVAMLVLAGTSFAATINVPGDYPTIQGAINAAFDGDTIVVHPGSYLENIEIDSISIRIEGAGANQTILDGDQVGPVVRATGLADVYLSGLRITNGLMTEGLVIGGGVSAVNLTSLTIEDCVIESNQSDYHGGGLGSLDVVMTTVRRTDFIANLAGPEGGCCGSHGGAVSIRGLGGGGPCDGGSSASFEACRFIDNQSFTKGSLVGQGGAIYFDNVGNETLLLSDCYLAGNSAEADGASLTIGGLCGPIASRVDIMRSALMASSGESPVIGGVEEGLGVLLTVSDSLICQELAGDPIAMPYEDLGGNQIGGDCIAADCNGDGIADYWQILNGTSSDCNGNEILDECDITEGTSYDCDENGEPDECQPDCDGDGWIDPCDSEGDLDGDGIPDNCEDDCNDNGIPDEWEIKNGWGTDCDGNGILDECDVTTDPSLDCNANGIHDACDIADGSEEDCDGNAIPDSCQLEGQGPEGAVQWTVEEGGNGHWYQTAIANGDCFDEIRLAALSQFGDLAVIESLEENQFITALLIPDGDYWIGLTQNLESPQYSEPGGGWEWIDGTALVYENWDSDEPNNGGSIGEDVCGISYDGTWYDMESCDSGGDQYAVIEWDAGFFSLDCNANDIPDECDIADGTSNDVNGNGIPDECEVDCNENGVPDHWDIKTGTSEDCNANGIPDECDTADGTSNDVNSNGIPDECEEDCNDNGSPDDWDLVTGWSEDCNGNLIPDECDLAAGQSPEGAVQWTVEEGGNGHWYAAISLDVGPGGFGGTHYQYLDAARAIGGDLASVTTSEEDDWLRSNVAAPEDLWQDNGGGCLCVGPMIGAFRDAFGQWTWTDGTTWDYTAWHGGNPGEPQDLAACAIYWDRFGSYLWQDSAADAGTFGFPSAIVEWSADGGAFSADCNANNIPDECDIADETSEDINSDGVPDECQCLADIAGPDGPGLPDGIVGTDDLLAVIGYWGQSQPVGDIDNDGTVGVTDLLAVIGNWGPCP